MSRRATAFLLLALAAGLGYGRFGLPILMQSATPDSELDEKRRVADEQLLQWVDEHSVPSPEEGARVLTIVMNHERRSPRVGKPGDDEIVGTVDAVWAEELVMLGIGSDAGLAKGMTIDIHRHGPRPFCLVSIIETWPDRAVGQIIHPCPPVRPGDAVRRIDLFLRRAEWRARNF
jgi:hypothetical protein